MEGVGNFGVVSPQLLRGAQPTALGFDSLRAAGVSIDVDLRSPYPQAAKERAASADSGLRYVHLYWRAEPFWSVPNFQDVRDFLNLMRAAPMSKVFVHCRQGSDRTGVCVAAYRIMIQGWTPRRAAEEMSEYGYHWYLFPRWRRWVEKLVPGSL